MIVVQGSDTTVIVPGLTGLTAADAQAVLGAAGLGSDLPAGGGGSVLSQSPAAGASLEIGALVHLELGPQPSPSTTP